MAILVLLLDPVVQAGLSKDAVELAVEFDLVLVNLEVARDASKVASLHHEVLHGVHGHLKLLDALVQPLFRNVSSVFVYVGNHSFDLVEVLLFRSRLQLRSDACTVKLEKTNVRLVWQVRLEVLLVVLEELDSV